MNRTVHFRSKWSLTRFDCVVMEPHNSLSASSDSLTRNGRLFNKYRRTGSKIHKWLGMVFGAIVACICLSGASLVFEEEITKKLNPQFHKLDKVADGQKPVELSQLLRDAQKSLPDGAEILNVTVSRRADVPYKLTVMAGGRQTWYIDQYTGKLIGQQKRGAFFLTMFKLHRWLLFRPYTDSGKPSAGKMTVGISTIMFFLLLVTGYILFWPSNWSGLKKRLVFPAKGTKFAKWLWCHNAGGAICGVMLMVLCLTGLTWSFKWFSNGFYNIFEGNGSKSSLPANTPPSSSDIDFEAWQRAYNSVKMQRPTEDITVSNGKVSVLLDGVGNPLKSDTYIFRSEGLITGYETYQLTSRSEKARGWVHALHLGNWCGWFSKTLNFIVALWGALLAVSGFRAASIIYVKRRAANR